MYKLKLSGNPNVGTKVQSTLTLESNGIIGNVNKISSPTFEDAIKTIQDVTSDSLLSKLEPNCLSDECLNLVKLIIANKKNLSNDNIGKSEMALAFGKLLQVARRTSTDEFIRILNARSTADFKEQIIDLLGATQTASSHEAIKKVLKFDSEDDFDLSERYFQALSVGTRPNVDIILGEFDGFRNYDVNI